MIEKNPSYKLDYKKLMAISDHRIIREKASMESKEIQEQEKQRLFEKRDIYMSRKHDALKRKAVVGHRLNKHKKLMLSM
jgi:hypothetical protein